MKALLMRLILPPVAVPPPPPKNEFRCYAVPMDGVGFIYFKQVLHVDIQKHELDFVDEDSKGLNLGTLKWLDSLLPEMSANVLMTGPEYDHLLFYLSDRLIRMTNTKRSLLANVDVLTLSSALRGLRDELLEVIEITPMSLYRA